MSKKRNYKTVWKHAPHLSNMADKIFADGFSFRSPAQGAPEFVLGRLSCNTSKAIEFLKAHTDDRGWVNMKILLSKGGTEYIELDTWKPKLEKPESLKVEKFDEENDTNEIPW